VDLKPGFCGLKNLSGECISGGDWVVKCMLMSVNCTYSVRLVSVRIEAGLTTAVWYHRLLPEDILQ